jgi:hypothetical protein
MGLNKILKTVTKNEHKKFPKEIKAKKIITN